MFKVGDKIRRRKHYEENLGSAEGRVVSIVQHAGGGNSDRDELIIHCSSNSHINRVANGEWMTNMRGNGHYLRSNLADQRVICSRRSTLEEMWEPVGEEHTAPDTSNAAVSSEPEDEYKRQLEFFKGRSFEMGPSGLLFP